MLKITTTRNETESVRVYLCGQLTGEYVPELKKVLEPDTAEKIALDMSDVTFVDRPAMEYLCGMKSRISIENIPSYVIRWIELEGRCGPSSQK
jgi:anti-anti-sigma regulatory factor